MNEEVRRGIGARLKESRRQAKLSQEEVASELQIKRQSVSEWENGKALPASHQWYRLGMILGVSLDYLAYGIRTVPVSQHDIMASVFRVPESRPSAAASGIPERLPAS